MYRSIIDNIITEVEHKLTSIDLNDDSIDNLLTTYKDNQDITLTLISTLLDTYRDSSVLDKPLLLEYIKLHIRYSVKIKILSSIHNTTCKKSSIKDSLNNIDKLVDKIIDTHTDNQFTTITNLEYILTKLKYTDNNIYLTIKLLLHNKFLLDDITESKQ